MHTIIKQIGILELQLMLNIVINQVDQRSIYQLFSQSYVIQTNIIINM